MMLDRFPLGALVVVALVTGLTRALPYFLFGGKRGIPPAIRYLGTVLPASIMIILVLYCLRKINFGAFPFGLAELLSVAVVVVAQLVRRNTFLSIALGTACYMLLLRTLLPV